MEKGKIFEFNGAKLEIDLYDVECMARYETALQELAEKQAQPKNGMKLSEAMKTQCMEYREFFNTIFDDQTAGEKMFGGQHRVSVCIEAYYDFLAFAAEQGEAEYKRIQAIKSKYNKAKMMK